METNPTPLSREQLPEAPPNRQWYWAVGDEEWALWVLKNGAPFTSVHLHRPVPEWLETQRLLRIANGLGARGDGPRKGIYIASKTHHAPKWLELRANGLPIVSTWIDEAGPGQSADLSDLWRRCTLEASTASALVVYRETDDILKGAFIEVGIALASNVPVFAVGCKGQSFTNHRLVTCCDTLDDAIRLAQVASLPASATAEDCK